MAVRSRSALADAFALFVEEADARPIVDVFDSGGWRLSGRGGHVGGANREITGPCPSCGGVDCFSIHPGKNVWNCRKLGKGGHSPVSMVAHFEGLDLRSRDGFRKACEIVLGRSFEAGATQDEQEIVRRRERAAARAEKSRLDRERSANAFRDRARARARAIWKQAVAPSFGGPVLEYLRLRCGIRPEQAGLLHLRESAMEPYWMEPQGRRDRPHVLLRSPAMAGAIVSVTREVIGVHFTWVDPGNEPKHRLAILHPRQTGEILPAKKMRGSQKGGLIGLAGKWESPRWVGGEGIENGLAVAVREGFRPDTFYVSGCSLANLAGPGANHGATSHPFLKNGNGRPQRIPTPLPQPDQSPAHEAVSAMPLPSHVREFVLLADGDSELFWTAAMVARALARFSVPGRTCLPAWPPHGTDWAQYLMDGGEWEAPAPGFVQMGDGR